MNPFTQRKKARCWTHTLYIIPPSVYGVLPHRKSGISMRKRENTLLLSNGRARCLRQKESRHPLKKTLRPFKGLIRRIPDNNP